MFYEIDPWDRIHNITFSLQLTNQPDEIVLHNTRLERLASDKHSNLLVQFVSYEEYTTPGAYPTLE